jgi:hypothetical protein
MFDDEPRRKLELKFPMRGAQGSLDTCGIPCAGEDES